MAYIRHSKYPNTAPMRISSLNIATDKIIQHFDSAPQKILRLSEIASILEQQRSSWHLPLSVTKTVFIRHLTQKAQLKRLDFPFPYRKEHRYIWGEIPLWEVLLTLKKNAYFSHQTAMQMHSLTSKDTKSIYLNHEQVLRSQESVLEQHRIDAAFSRSARASKNTIKFGNFRICLINGMNTGNLGVINLRSNLENYKNARIQVTNIERTLIDIAVRPIYAGGIFEILTAYKKAKNDVSVILLTSMLRQLKYTYPYHQAIGFYLERAGYKQTDINLLKEFPMNFNFYLANKIEKAILDPNWKIYIPEELR